MLYFSFFSKKIYFILSIKYKFLFFLKIIDQLIEYHVFLITSHAIKIVLKYFLSAKSNRNKDETIPELWQSREKTCLRSSLFYLSNIHYSSKPQNINEFACLVSTYLIYPRYDENVDSAEDRYLFRDESVPLMELTVQIISKVFLLDGRQVLFHVSVNIPKPSRKPSGKKKEYMFESNRKTR